MRGRIGRCQGGGGGLEWGVVVDYFGGVGEVGEGEELKWWDER